MCLIFWCFCWWLGVLRAGVLVLVLEMDMCELSPWLRAQVRWSKKGIMIIDDGEFSIWNCVVLKLKAQFASHKLRRPKKKKN